ncbi:MAG: sugar phosphate isomerase/epimerase [Chloroflexota bacterium]|nr:sugar phosphate isomerase/epimerase [Chloroflexota bacterium]
MRLGVVDMLPKDFRTCTPAHLSAITALGFTGFGCHLDGALAAEITTCDCAAFKALFSAAELELAQFSLAYSECLFAPEPAVRAAVTEKIGRGIVLARQLEAQALLIRPGSLNPAGPWTPARENHRPESLERLIDTLRPIAAHAEAAGVLLVMETHATSIMDSPEVCRAVVEAVGGPTLRLTMDVVNHFQTLRQVYSSADRIDHIFDVIGDIAPVAHIKDIVVQNKHVLHLDEAVPGEGELDTGRLLRRFQALYPHGYGLIEHLPIDRVPLANANVRRIAAEHGVPIDE